MNTLLNQQLVQVKVNEMLQEAAEARADRKACVAHSNPVARTLKFALTAVPFVLWIVWAFVTA